MHVLITGARAPACLEWARAFALAGWRVSAADSMAIPMVRGSRYVSRYHRLPEPRGDLKAWADALRAIVTAESVDLLLPVCEDAIYLARIRDTLPCRVYTDSFERLVDLHHKGRFAALTQGWEVAAPETHLLQAEADMAPFLESSRDWVFKRVYSRFASATLIRPAPDELRALQPTPDAAWLAQRYVAGKEYCSYSLFTDGKLTAHACYHPRYRVGKGSGIYFEPADPLEVRRFVERFGRETGYTGQAGFDFIAGDDGCSYVLECNPRGTSGVHLFAAQPHELVAAVHAPTGATLTPAPARERMVGLAMLLIGAPRYGWRDMSFWHALLHARDTIEWTRDPLPGLMQLTGMSEVIYRALRGRQGLLAAATRDIEWDGQPVDAC